VSRGGWKIRKSELGRETERWQLLGADDATVSFAQLGALWKEDERFRTFWTARLREVPFDGYCWECPPVTRESSTTPFECVFVSSPLLAETSPDPSPFAEHFRPGCRVATFESLGRDALLVAPCPGGTESDFAHLATFVATATTAEASALWQAAGDAFERRLGTRPLWLSTAGLGVYWLHVRLDSRPKYYRHDPYRKRLGA
jgi:hypothetical protein